MATLPYITPAEYKASPVAVDYSNLITGDATQAHQDAALATEILRASAWIDGVLNQSLIAQSTVEFHECTVARDGSISIHPDGSPLNQLVQVQLGSAANDLVTVSDLTGVYPIEQNWVIPDAGMVGSVPIQFTRSRSGGRVLAKITCLSGWGNTTLSTSITTGNTTLPVVSGAGFSPAAGTDPYGSPLWIYDPANGTTEQVTVVSATATSITIAGPGVVAGHAAGCAVSTLPADVKEAAVIAAGAFIRNRGSDSWSMAQALSPGVQVGDMTMRGAGLPQAQRMLASAGYARVR